MKRALLWTGLVLLGICTLLIAGGAWLLSTNSGTTWAFARARAFTDGALQVERVEGTLAGPLVLTNARYRNPKVGVDAAIERVQLDVSIRDLLRMTAHVVAADIRGVVVKLTEPTEPPPPEDDTPFTLEAPIDIIVDAFDVHGVSVSRDEAALVGIDAAAFAGQWIGSNVVVRRLDVRSPQGEVHFAADVHQRQYYEGEGRGTFRWQLGERTIAGSLVANGASGATNLGVDLAAPVDARVTAELKQERNWPWKFTLDAPTFDPREELLPGSSLTSLAAQLNGEGTLQEGLVGGVVTINGEPIRIERMHVEQQPDAIDMDTLVHLGGGRMSARGLVRTKETPVSADLRILWRDIVVPAALAGQELFTRGDLNVSGSAEAYRANGTMKLGPQQRIADLEVNVQGSPQRIDLQQFDIVQKQGRLALTGRVDLTPNIAWSLRAQSQAFDPGAFAVKWPGRLNFDLASAGSLPEAGPQGTLVLSNLRGTLRNRDIGGRADLKLASNKTLTGDLDMTSGRSRVQLTAERGNKLDAVANINVPALDDWLPDAGGSLHGRIAVQGLWPQWHVTGELHGEALQYATTRAQTLEARWDIDKPLQPSGNATLDVTQLVAGGFEFATVRTRAQGDMQRHNIQFDATGEPLAAAFALDGSSRDDTWSGALQRMTIDVKDAAKLALRQPVQITYSPQRMSFTQACFADGDIRLCFEGERAANGAMQANYSLANLPLSLANAVMPPSMPLVFEGAIEGRGDVAAAADGTLRGRADIRSQKGRISRQFAATADAPEVLLTYDDLSLVADLAGPNANARLSARLNDTGSLQGRLAARGLAQASTGLDGAIDVALPSLRVIELFAPQLANVQGRAELHAGVRGTLDDPQLSGEFRASNLGTDVPRVGLKLKDGVLSVTPTSKNSFKIAGSIASGQGKLDLSGEATTAGVVHMKLAGKQFQAADIPAVQVVIDPQLEFERVPERMQITGQVHVPSANVDLQKLPKKERTQGVSADVVVIDAVTQEQAQAEAVPLFANIKVTLSDKVSIVGYGLDAKVSGELDVKEQPGAATSGSGTVRVEGTYKAYGQDLEIRQGQLMFAGTPLDNPRLNFVAVRVIEDEDVTAGLKVTGSAQMPELVVFSEPAMSQSDALAYVVTGKPLNEVGEGEGEGDMLQAAARSLGTATGGVLAKNIGKRLGVDEFGIKDSEALGGAALTIGQYLSPRLFVSYGVGVFEPGKVLTMRYKLSKELAIEALNSTKDSQAGIEYRVER